MRLRMPTAALLSGTRCSRPFFIRSAGAVHALVCRSISSQRAEALEALDMFLGLNNYVREAKVGRHHGSRRMASEPWLRKGRGNVPRERYRRQRATQSHREESKANRVRRVGRATRSTVGIAIWKSHRSLVLKYPAVSSLS